MQDTININTVALVANPSPKSTPERRLKSTCERGELKRVEEKPTARRARRRKLPLDREEHLARSKEIERKLINDVILHQYEKECRIRDKLVGQSNVPTRGVKNDFIRGPRSNKESRKILIQSLRDRKQMQDGSIDIQDLFANDKLHIFETSLLFLYDCHRGRGFPDYVVAAMHMFKHLFKKNVLDFIDVFKGFLSDIDVFTMQDGLFGETYVDFLSCICTGIKNIFKTETYTKLKKFLIFIWSMAFKLIPTSVVAGETFERLAPYLKVSEVDLSGGYLFDMVDSVLFLIKQGYQSVKCGKALAFFHSSDSYTEWLDKAHAMPEQEILLNCVDKSKQITLIDLIKQYDDLIRQGKEMASLFTGREHAHIVAETNLLIVKRTGYYNNVLSMKLRKAPFPILLCSRPEMGKSTFTKILQTFFAQVKNLPNDNDSRYIRNFSDEFWSNFKTSMWCIILDDLGFEHINKISTLREASINEIIQIINNVAYIVKMAKLEEKGNVACMPELVIGTTNHDSMNVQHLYNTPMAVLRRFPYVVKLFVKDKYQDKERKHRPLKASSVPEGELNLWNIKIQTPFEDPDTKEIKYDTLHKFTELSDFLKWYEGAIHAHDAAQEKVLSAGKGLEETTFCLKCYKPTPCNCPEVQSAVVYDPMPELLNVTLDPSLNERLVMQDAHVDDNRMNLQVIKNFFFCYINNSCVWCSYITWFFRIMLFWSPKSVVLYQFLNLSFWNCVAYGLFAYQFEWYWKWLPFWVKKLIFKRIGKALTSRIYQQNEILIQLTLTFLTTSAIIITLRKLCFSSSRTATVQGGVLSAVDQSKNVYYTDIEPAVSTSFGETISSWKALSEEQVITKLKHNVVHIIAGENVPFKSGCGLYISGQVILTNYHLFAGRRHFQIQYETDGICKVSHKYLIPDSDILEMPDRDLMFIRVRQLPGRRKIAGLFPNVIVKDLHAYGHILRFRHSSQSCHVSERALVKYAGVVTVHHEETRRDYINHNFCINVTDTIKGDCGAPYVVWAPCGPCIVGLHESLGEYAHCVAVTRKSIEEGLNHLNSDFSGGSLIRDTLPFTITPLSKNSNIRRIEGVSGHVFGSTNRRFPASSRVEKTDLYQSIVDAGISDNFGKPVMRDREVWINQIEPIVNKEVSLDLALLDAAKAMYIREVVDVLTDNQMICVGVLSDFENINGAAGRPYLNKINRNTSAGFPLNCSKLMYLDILEDDTCVVDQKIWDDAYALEQAYMAGERAYPIFMGCLKDEIITKKKIEKKKTRMFTGSPFSWTIVIRKYYLTLVELIEENNLLFESCPGMNPLSVQWSELCSYLTHFGEDRICAGDYAAFDKNMSPAVILAAFDILILIAEKRGFSETEIQVMKLIAQDVAFPVLAVDGDLLMAHGMNPSGHPLTVIINCLVNCLYLRMAFIAFNKDLDFKEHVHLATYGDDNIFGVSKKCKFDHVLLSQFLAGQGIQYTMADKETKSIPFINISEATFLKRAFVYNEDLGIITSQLEIDSIHKGLLYTIPSKAICKEQQLIEKMLSELRELFYHGFEKYNFYRNIFIKFLDENDSYAQLNIRLPTYEEYLDDMRIIYSLEIPQVQDGVVNDELCTKCMFADCEVRTSPDTCICPRCKRCRWRDKCYDDIYFRGCFYCECYMSMTCDICNSPSIYKIWWSGYLSVFICEDCNKEDSSDMIQMARRSHSQVEKIES